MSAKWSLIDLPKIDDPRGSISVVEAEQHIPFKIERVYWLYEVPGHLTRASHAHKELYQLMVCVSGSLDIHLDDGRTKQTITLRRPHQGLLLRPMVWRELENFSFGAVCMVLASMHYTESDYYRNYDEFLQAVDAL